MFPPELNDQAAALIALARARGNEDRDGRNCAPAASSPAC